MYNRFAFIIQDAGSCYQNRCTDQKHKESGKYGVAGLYFDMVAAPTFFLYDQWPYNKSRGSHRGTDKSGHHHFSPDGDGRNKSHGNILNGRQYDEHGNYEGKSHYGNENDQDVLKKTVFHNEQE